MPFEQPTTPPPPPRRKPERTDEDHVQECLHIANEMAARVCDTAYKDPTDMVTGYLMAMMLTATWSKPKAAWTEAFKRHTNCSDEYIATMIIGG